MSAPPHRHRRTAAALVSMVAILVVVAAFAAVFLSIHSVQLSTREAAIHRLRAQAAALAATQLTLWKLSNDPDLQAAVARVVYEGDTSFQADPLFTVQGDLAGATFNVDVWPGADTARLRTRGVSAGAYYDRWAHVPLNFGYRFGHDTVEDLALRNVAHQQIAIQVVLPENGMVTSISAYVKGPPPKTLRYAIYTDSGGEPGSLIVETAPEAGGSDTFHWHTIGVAPTALTAGTYWLALAFEHNTMYVRQSDPGAGQLRYKSHDAADSGFLSSWGVSDASDTTQICIYGTYTPN